MNNPLVSIIIDNYNYGRFLGQAIESALAQDYANKEVIVVDDGSADNSREVIAQFGERVQAILKPNGGQASAFNAGLAASQGEIIIFLDADDYLYPAAATETAAHWRPGLAKVQFRLDVVDPNGQISGRLPKEAARWLPNGNALDMQLKWGFYPSPPTSGNAFSRDFMNAVKPIPEEEYRICADTYLIFLAPYEGAVISIDKVLGAYRQHGSNHFWFDAADLSKFRKALVADSDAEELMISAGEQKGLRVDKALTTRNPRHLIMRLASLRLDKRTHPFKQDRQLALALRGILATWDFSIYSFAEMTYCTAWFLFAGLLPVRLVRPLLTWAYARGNRPEFLKALVRTWGSGRFTVSRSQPDRDPNPRPSV